MKTFDDYVSVILRHEGGYVNHPNDPGGATNYGISLRFLKGSKIDLNKDGIVDLKDIRSLTKQQASGIYLKYFWQRMRIDGIENELLKLHLFDMGINAGTGTAVKILQRMVGVGDDGIIGKRTLQAIVDYPGEIVEAYKKARKVHYLKLIKRNPKLSVFKNGWFNRVDSTKFSI